MTTHDGSNDAAAREVAALVAIAERLDALAETAELMGDAEGAARLRAQSAGQRLEALHLLDG